MYYPAKISTAVDLSNKLRVHDLRSTEYVGYGAESVPVCT